MSEYKDAIIECMDFFAQDEKTIFLGQQVWPMDFYGTLANIPQEKRLELPIAEEMQTGIAIGLAFEGFLPISIYQRMDFLMRTADQLVNHLDKIKDMSRGIFNPKVILRTSIGSKIPLDVGPQHSQDFTEAFRVLFDNIEVIKPETSKEIKSAYMKAYNKNGSFLIVEQQDLY